MWKTDVLFTCMYVALILQHEEIMIRTCLIFSKIYHCTKLLIAPEALENYLQSS